MGTIHQRDRPGIVKLVLLALFLPVLGACGSSGWAGTYVGDAKVSAMSGAATVATGQASGISLAIIEKNSSDQVLEIGEGGVITNCRMRVTHRGGANGQTGEIAVEKSYDQTPKPCALRIQGQTLTMEGYTISTEYDQSRFQDGRLNLKVHFYSGTPNQTYYSFEFTGKRRGWFF